MFLDTFDFYVPASWKELSQSQLVYLFKLLALNLPSETIKLRCLFRWNRVKVIGKQRGDSYLLQYRSKFMVAAAGDLAMAIRPLDYIDSLPKLPVNIKKLRRHKSLPTNFEGVPFETFIIADNLYQGYLKTNNNDLLADLAGVLYGISKTLKPWERIAVFYWFASLKAYLSWRFADFFQPIVPDDNLLGTSADIEAAVNAQIRALTNGDITKEAEVLALDTYRALTELNARAREYKDMKTKYDAK